MRFVKYQLQEEYQSWEVYHLRFFLVIFSQWPFLGKIVGIPLRSKGFLNGILYPEEGIERRLGAIVSESLDPPVQIEIVILCCHVTTGLIPWQ